MFVGSLVWVFRESNLGRFRRSPGCFFSLLCGIILEGENYPVVLFEVVELILNRFRP